MEYFLLWEVLPVYYAKTRRGIARLILGEISGADFFESLRDNYVYACVLMRKIILFAKKNHQAIQEVYYGHTKIDN
jgi:hypothetical protein